MIDKDLIKEYENEIEEMIFRHRHYYDKANRWLPSHAHLGKEEREEPAAVGRHPPPVQAGLRRLPRQPSDPPLRPRRGLEKDDPDHLRRL